MRDIANEVQSCVGDSVAEAPSGPGRHAVAGVIGKPGHTTGCGDDEPVNNLPAKRWSGSDIRQVTGRVWALQEQASAGVAPSSTWHGRLGTMGSAGAKHNAGQVRRLFEAAADLDLDHIARYLHEECRYWNLPLPAWTAGKGRRSTLRQLRALSVVVSEYRVLEYIQLTAGERVVVVDRLECLRILGVRCRLRVVALFEFRDGKILSWNDDFSMRDLSVGFLRGLFRITSVQA